MDSRHAVLFEPVQIGPKTAPNRFYQVPHASGFGSMKPRTHAAFRAVKAEGGWGVVNVDYSPVSLDSEEYPAIAADCWDLDDMKRLGVVAEAIHEHGALAGIELYHGGAESLNGESRYPRLAPSQIGSDWRRSSFCKEMTLHDIERVQSDYVLAAKRARDVGYDIVYVYGAHGYLMTQMLSTETNRRTDRYGGSLENRARFQLETIERVRAEIGDDCAIAVRMAVFGGKELPGIELDEMLEVIRMFDPVVDLFDVNVGSWPEDSGTSRYYPEGHQRPWTSQVRQATSKPIVSVGRFTNPDLMASMVRSGELDFIGAARPAIADPFLPQKIREGRLDEVRECTGSNLCILREESLAHVGCIQNATAGEEYRRGWHPEIYVRPKNPQRAILVIGGGPAGMECAMVLGKSGYDAVHLVEATDALGGKMRWTRQLPTLGDWGRVIDHRVIGLNKLDNVEVILGRTLSVDDVLDYGADTIIVATGSSWNGDGLQSHQREPISNAKVAFTPEQIMAGARPPMGRVVVYDCDGYYVAAGLAELLAGEGYAVHLVTSLPRISPISDESLEGDFLRQHLHDCGIEMTTGITITDVTVSGAAPDGVSGETEFGDEWRDDAVGVVLVTLQVSDDALYRDLISDQNRLQAAGISAVYAIGDAVAPRMPSEAIFDGHRLARELESDDPMVPKPWLRERPTI